MNIPGLAAALFAWGTPFTPPAPPVLDGPPAPVLVGAVRERRERHRRRLPRPIVAVRAAMRELGAPYRWGGQTPRTGFDCSGLVRFAWSQAGVWLPRTTYAQIRTGVGVTLSRVRRGDLLFPDVGHVQMAVGHGLFIESPHTGARVRLGRLLTSYIAIRRPLAAHLST